jgi:TP53 regulating kinase-like protein
MSASNGDNEAKSHFPAPKSEWEMMFQGAEARLWRLPWRTPAPMVADENALAPQGDPTTRSRSTVMVVCKERFSKSYRHPDLDARLTKSRCRSEARLLEKCHRHVQQAAAASCWRVPRVVQVDPPLLYLEYLQGATALKQVLLEKTSSSNHDGTLDGKVLAQRMGHMVASLHALGIVHGDLTTSNMMVQWKNAAAAAAAASSETRRKRPREEHARSLSDDSQGGDDDDDATFSLVLVDFGLAKATWSVEEQAVDLYVLERALQSTHPDLEESFFDEWLLPSYQATIEKNATTNNNGKNKTTETALQRLEQVRRRGRKRECFG